MGQMEMAQLQTHDMVLAMNPQGELQFSPVLMWLDRDEVNSELFVELQTKSGQTIRLTSSHLIYVADEPMEHELSTTASQAPPPAPAPAPQSLPTDDLNNANKSTAQTANGNNYYYYDIASGGGSQIPPAANALSGEIQVNTTTNESLASHGLGDYIYTTYARNALVGQYLLVSSPEEQVVEFGVGGSPSDQRASFGRSQSFVANGRLTFARQPDLSKRETTRREAKRGAKARSNRSPSAAKSPRAMWSLAAKIAVGRSWPGISRISRPTWCPRLALQSPSLTSETIPRR